MSSEANQPTDPPAPLGPEDAPTDPLVDSPEALPQLLREVLGYLNFSSGATDGKFLRAINTIYGQLETAEEPTDSLAVDQFLSSLSDRLAELAGEGGAFAEATQAEAVIRLVKEFRETYAAFHRDLLWSRSDDRLWRPFFMGRVFEAILTHGAPWDAKDFVDEVRDKFDDYLGYRPIATLETDQEIEPYRNESLRPLPLYIESAGVAHGPFEELILCAIEILRDVDDDLLRAAWFDPDLLQEMALDPRAYDFDHPAHKRPNHHFGQWDPDHIDGSGNYRRFVLQPIVLNALMARIDQASSGQEEGSYSREELIFEAAAVLAGTILMAAGVSGSGPNVHSSEETLSTLLPQIAAYRDRFYEQLLERAKGPHADRLRREAQQKRQPFAGARQFLNHEIARRRAEQLQQVHLARVYARMGRADAALEEARIVRVASARILCQIYCRLTAGHQAIDSRDLETTVGLLTEIEDLIERGIQCGALVDPWNVVGFGGNFSLFPAIENTVHDYRVDDLIQLVEQLLGLCSRAWTEAAAIDDSQHEKIFSEMLGRLTTWWDQFATPMVGGVRHLLAKEIEVSTNLVAGALNAWHKAGSAAGDIGFWGMFVDQFDSPKAFQLVLEALFEKEDVVASMALLMRWLCQVDMTPLEDGESSFHPLADRWLTIVESRGLETGEDQWPLIAKFFDHLEANAEEYWDAPRFELGIYRDPDDPLDDLLGDDLTEEELFDEGPDGGSEDEDDAYDDSSFEEGSLEEEEEDDLGLFDAAYEGVTFEDSTDDGMESSTYDPTDDETRLEYEEEAQRLESRLAFLKTVARLWKHAASAWGVQGATPDDRNEKLKAWRRAAAERCAQLGQLLEAVHKRRLPLPGGDHESMVEYDRLRMVKDAIVEGVIATHVEMADAARLLRAAVGAVTLDEGEQSVGKTSGAAVSVLRAVLRGDTEGVTEHWDHLIEALLAEESLYIPLSKGGDPRKIVRVLSLHRLVADLLRWLPRLGMVREACQLLHVAQRMELEHSVGSGAVTEYDRLFNTGYEAIVRCLVASADNWDPTGSDTPVDPNAVRHSDGLLVQSLQDLTESQLEHWLQHSRTVRLSAVERLGSSRDWERFVQFVERYGEDLFTQRFLTLGNLRAILHQQVDEWLETLADKDSEESPRLIQELNAGISTEEATRQLSTVLESIIENYREYRDYNTTTTQSDHGEMLYGLIDFLRLKNNYDRIAWNLKPVYLAHKILVRNGRPAAAELWRRAVAERTAEAADEHQASFNTLCEKYGMRLASIAERIGERFTRPLVIDRLRSLVGPAMTDTSEEADESFAAIRREADDLAETPSGSGLDMPDWVAALEKEVSSQRRQQRHHASPEEALQRIDQVRLDWIEAQMQLGATGESGEEE